jgi:hypothetical protein
VREFEGFAADSAGFPRQGQAKIRIWSPSKSTT